MLYCRYFSYLYTTNFLISLTQKKCMANSWIIASSSLVKSFPRPATRRVIVCDLHRVPSRGDWLATSIGLVRLTPGDAAAELFWDLLNQHIINLMQLHVNSNSVKLFTIANLIYCGWKLCVRVSDCRGGSWWVTYTVSVIVGGDGDLTVILASRQFSNI